MASVQDHQIGTVDEVTYGTYVAPTRFYEYTEDDLDYLPNTVQGTGMRVSARAARSARRVRPTVQAGGSFKTEILSKGYGKMWEYLLGTNTSTNVSGATYQQVVTLSDSLKSFTLQKGISRWGGTVDAYSFVGSMVASAEIEFPNAGIPTVTWNIDSQTVDTGQSLASASYASTPTLYSFAGGSIYLGGTLTAPTTTALGSLSGSANLLVRGGSLTINNNLAVDRFNLSGSGLKTKPIRSGLIEITGTLDVEYDSTTFRDAYKADTSMGLLVQFAGAALSTGNETLQVIVPDIRLEGEMPKAPGPEGIVMSLPFTGFYDLTNQPIYVVARTADTAA